MAKLIEKYTIVNIPMPGKIYKVFEKSGETSILFTTAMCIREVECYSNTNYWMGMFLHPKTKREVRLSTKYYTFIRLE